MIRVKDTTLLAINCHLAKHDVQKRRDQYGDLCRKLGEGLGLPSSPGIGDVHCSYHHMIWFGDMNYHIKKPEDGGCTVEEAVSCIRDGEMHALYHYDELFHDLNLDERPEERKPLCFCGFVEPEKWQSGPLPTRFYPTYKKDARRGTAEAASARPGGSEAGFLVPQTTEDIAGERDWVRRVYNIDFQEKWYKGGSTKLRMPSWTDRIVYRSMPHLVDRLKPACKNDDDRYRAINEVLLTSDHSPICCVFELQPEDCRTEPHYKKMSAAQKKRAQASQELKQLRLTFADATIARDSDRAREKGHPPAKMVGQCPGPFGKNLSGVLVIMELDWSLTDRL